MNLGALELRSPASMACLARTVSGCSSGPASRSLEWAQGSIVSSSFRIIRLYAGSRVGKSVKQEHVKDCLIGFRNQKPTERPIATSAFNFTNRIWASPSSSSRLAFHGPLSGSHDFSSSSNSCSRFNDKEKHSTSVECVKSSPSDTDAAFERRRRRYLEKLACPGCGVYMQDNDPKRPGYFRMPAIFSKSDDEFEEEVVGDMGEVESEVFSEDDVEEFSGRAELDESDFELDEDEEEMDMDTRLKNASDWNEVGGNKLAGKDAWAEILGGKNYRKKDGAQREGEEEEEEKVVVCARCHALRNYGKVKDESVENLLPDFDFERVVGARLKKAYGRRAVVLMVVDGSDFDGSFPRKAAEVLAEADEELGTAWQEGKSGNTPRLLVVMNKIDLLPKQISPNRLDQWIRRRSKAGGVNRIAGVHTVSAFKGWGVEQLAEHIKQLAGPRGDC